MSELRRTSDGDHSDSDADRFKGVSLAARKIGLIRRMPGYNKSKHRVPDNVNDRAQSFIGALASGTIQDDLDRVFQLLRNAFRFKRTELQTHETDDGAGCIQTPFFRYTSCVYQNPTNASEVVWQQDISDVADPSKLLTDEFEAVFGQAFDTVEFLPTSPIVLESLIDTIEDIDDERVRLEYDRQLTYCEVFIEGTIAKLQVTPAALRMVYPEPANPSLLVATFFEFQDALLLFQE